MQVDCLHLKQSKNHCFLKVKQVGKNYWCKHLKPLFVSCLINTMILKPVIYSAIISYLLLLVIVWLLPVGFNACAKDSLACRIAYWLTESAGKYGTIIIIALTSYFYTVSLNRKRDKLVTFFLSFIALAVFLSVFAFTNEHGTKKLIQTPRPSHLYMLEQTGQQVLLDSLYNLSKDERQQAFTQIIQNNLKTFSRIDARVLQHWSEESGFSFPSGHSFNAFVLASVLAFSIRHIRSRSGLNKFYFLPFLWAVAVAVSRVAIGAHSALDVTVGGLLGLMVGIIFLYFDATRKLIIHKK